jgi:hypothetical protein
MLQDLVALRRKQLEDAAEAYQVGYCASHWRVRGMNKFSKESVLQQTVIML